MESIIQIVISYLLLGERYNKKLIVTFLPTLLGLVLIFSQHNLNLTTFGLITIICSNFSSATLNVFYRTYVPFINTSIYSFYLNLNLFSFVFFLPVYLTKTSTQKNSIIHLINNENSFDIVQYLIIGSLFNFLCNYFSISYLFNNSKSLHDYFTIIKQMFMQILSIFIVSTQLTKYQLIGIIISDIGLLFYSYLRIRKVSGYHQSVINKNFVATIKFIFIISQFLLILYFSSSYHTINKSVVSYKLAKIDHESKSWNLLNIVNEQDFKRIKCVDNLRNKLINTYRNLFQKHTSISSIDIYTDDDGLPRHLSRLAEEILIEELSLKVTSRLTDSSGLDNLINSDHNDIFLIHSSDNFRDQTNQKAIIITEILNRDKDRTKITFPQTITNLTNTYYTNDKLIFVARDTFSYDFAVKNFPTEMKIELLPDILFMIGSVNPAITPIYDIVILKGSFYKNEVWDEAFKPFRYHYSYIISTWDDYFKKDYFSSTEDVVDNGRRAHQIVNKIISQGKLIITDNLEASIYSILLGKVHVIVDDDSNQIKNFRDAIYSNIYECSIKYLRYYFARNPSESIKKASKILKTM
jgi:exopolysaccharide biosynthesis predicted pyruvyltransferase EpsI